MSSSGFRIGNTGRNEILKRLCAFLVSAKAAYLGARNGNIAAMETNVGDQDHFFFLRETDNVSRSKASSTISVFETSPQFGNFHRIFSDQCRRRQDFAGKLCANNIRCRAIDPRARCVYPLYGENFYLVHGRKQPHVRDKFIRLRLIVLSKAH